VRRRSRPGEISLKPAGEVVVTHEDMPAKLPEDKRIHPRRPLPPVPEAPSEDAGEGRKP
jgi:hypothetical protein